MIKLMRNWVLDFLAPCRNSPEPELKYNYDFKTGTIKLDMKSLIDSKVVQAQVAACIAQSEEQHSAANTIGRKNKSPDISRRRRRPKSSRRECPTTMHSL